MFIKTYDSFFIYKSILYGGTKDEKKYRCTYHFHASSIANNIIKARQNKNIEMTLELVEIIKRSIRN